MKFRQHKILRYLAIGVVAVALLLSLAAYLLLGISHTRRINDSVFQIYNSNIFGQIGANATVVDTSDGLVLFDSYLGVLADSLQRNITTETEKPVSTVINTHWHPDHTGGNALFSGAAEIFAHTNTIAILSTSQHATGLTRPGSTHEYPPVPAEALPTGEVEDKVTLANYNEPIELIHFPAAHTSGDLVAHLANQKIVILGDLVWPNSFPFIDQSNGGSATGILQALTAILDLSNPDYLFLVGHGEPLTRAELETYKQVVEDSISVIRSGKVAGKSADEMIETGLSEEFGSWASALVPESSWISAVYNTL